MGKTALIAGATGLVGKQLLTKLADSREYTKVVSLTRKPGAVKHDKIIEKIIDFGRLNEVEDLFSADDIFCCLGTTIKKAKSQDAFKKVDYDYPVLMSRFAAKQGASQFLVISALGADKDSRIFYSRVKGEMENEVLQSSIPTVGIFRPSLLTGNRQEWRAGERLGEIVSKPFSFLLLGKFRKYRPISADTVAEAMLRFAQKGQTGNRILLSDEIVQLAQKG